MASAHNDSSSGLFNDLPLEEGGSSNTLEPFRMRRPNVGFVASESCGPATDEVCTCPTSISTPLRALLTYVGVVELSGHPFLRHVVHVVAFILVSWSFWGWAFRIVYHGHFPGVPGWLDISMNDPEHAPGAVVLCACSIISWLCCHRFASTILNDGLMDRLYGVAHCSRNLIERRRIFKILAASVLSTVCLTLCLVAISIYYNLSLIGEHTTARVVIDTVVVALSYSVQFLSTFVSAVIAVTALQLHYAALSEFIIALKKGELDPESAIARNNWYREILTDTGRTLQFYILPYMFCITAALVLQVILYMTFPVREVARGFYYDAIFLAPLLVVVIFACRVTIQCQTLIRMVLASKRYREWEWDSAKLHFFKAHFLDWHNSGSAGVSVAGMLMTPSAVAKGLWPAVTALLAALQRGLGSK